MPSRPIPTQPLVWLPTSTIGSEGRALSRYSISVPRVNCLLTRRPCSCFRRKSEGQGRPGTKPGAQAGLRCKRLEDVDREEVLTQWIRTYSIRLTSGDEGGSSSGWRRVLVQSGDRPKGRRSRLRRRN